MGRRGSEDQEANETNFLLHSPIAKNRSPAAERMRRHRLKRRDGLRTFRVDLRETEIDELVWKGLLKPERRHIHNAVAAALYRFLDQALCRSDA